MKTYCGVNCDSCPFSKNCRGCHSTDGSPFGGKCVAAEYIKLGGIQAYQEFKERLTREINGILASEGIPETDCLYELAGKYVNLEYIMPSGDSVKLLNDKNIYLGAQIEYADLGICCGVVADTGFILICSYSHDGSQPELVLYKRR